MKKILIILLTVLILVLTIFTVVKGFEVGGIKVLGIKDMNQKNEELIDEVQKATKLATVDYEAKKTEVESNTKNLEKQKTKYDDMVSVSLSEDVQNSKQIPKYKIEFLWTTIGTHATREGVELKMDITNGTGGEGTYNLNFTATGLYVGISEFITDIEDDSSLGFKIEEFAMQPGISEDFLVATFSCKNITIEGIDKSNINNIDEQKNGNATNADKNNSNTTNGSSNTTNTTSNETNNISNTERYNPVDTKDYNKMNNMLNEV